jgi:hypothetical protein
MLKISPRAMQAISTARTAGFVERCAAFMVDRALAPAEKRKPLESWIQTRMPAIAAAGFASEQGLTLVIALELAYRRDLMSDDTIRQALGRADAGEIERVGKLRKAVVARFGEPVARPS